MGTKLAPFVSEFCAGALVAVGSSRCGQQSFLQTRPLILKYNTEYVLLVCHGQIRALSPLDL